MGRVFVFANPIAGRGKGRVYAHDVERALVAAGHEVRVFLKNAATVPAAQLEGLTEATAVVAIGGDGTLRATTARVLRECGVEKSCPPMLVVPMGTANLMGRHLGLAWNEGTLGREVAEVIGRGKVLQLDAARVRSTDYPEEAGAGLFGALPMKLGRRVIDRPKGTLEELLLLVAGVGLDAKVVHELARVRSGPISYASYALPAALALGRYRFPVVRVDVDGQRLWNGAGIVLVGNVKEYGTGFAVLPHARPDDGVLDVCVMPCGNPAELIQLFLLAAAGEHLESEGVLYVKGKRVRVEGEVPVELQVDGDAAGWTPVEIGLLERRVGFLVP